MKFTENLLITNPEKENTHFCAPFIGCEKAWGMDSIKQRLFPTESMVLYTDTEAIISWDEQQASADPPSGSTIHPGYQDILLCLGAAGRSPIKI